MTDLVVILGVSVPEAFAGDDAIVGETPMGYAAMGGLAQEVRFSVAVG